MSDRERAGRTAALDGTKRAAGQPATPRHGIATTRSTL
jgi:hypothetical protein